MSPRFYQLVVFAGGLSFAAFTFGASKRSSELQPPRQSTTVIIDAGHGGFDRGGIPGQSVAEKTVALDVAQRLHRVLEAGGYRVVMTRDSDVFVPLGTRVSIANSYRNGIFVCIHFNSARRSGANGIETYFYSRDSLALASAVHYSVTRSVSSSNRGVRRRGYFVLRKTRIPAVLVECGFLTNPTEARNAQNGAYRQRLADAIANGVRGRASVQNTLSSPLTIPLQPFIDQTRVRDPDLSRKKRSVKSKKRKSSTSKKEASAEKKAVIGYYIAADNRVISIKTEG
ncbi:MAG: N-acetylmuramoyl-L-alanine amidase [Verrucomicrobiota bacterium]|jgi:N-acetylmuramoyl-L-alanine amidase